MALGKGNSLGRLMALLVVFTDLMVLDDEEGQQ